MLQIGENIVFHVRSNKYVEHLNYMITNSGKVLEASTIRLAPYNMKTFHVMVTKEMAPVSKLTVWHIDSSGYLIVQVLTFSVDIAMKEQWLVSPCSLRISGCNILLHGISTNTDKCAIVVAGLVYSNLFRFMNEN